MKPCYRTIEWGVKPDQMKSNILLTDQAHDTPPAHEVESGSRQFLGHGRSAMVYRMDTESGDTARKMFKGSSSAAIAHLVFYGAPLAYRWNEAAVRSAFYRRKVLRPLLKYWFGDTLGISGVFAWGRDEDEDALYLDTEHIAGHRARHYSPFLSSQRTELSHLRERIMPLLQQHLMEAGVTGTVWQAGYGQPCALANFLCVQDGKDLDGHRWVWIDAESGVPAIVSYNLSALIKFYIPQALKHRRILFDDLDAKQLRSYLMRHEEHLQIVLDPWERVALARDVELLIKAHAEWADETRLSRSVGYYCFRGVISEEQRDYYLVHTFRWYAALARYLAIQVPRKLKQKVLEYLPLLKAHIRPVEWLKITAKGLVSPKYRLEMSRKFVEQGIENWFGYQRINGEQKDLLLKELRRDDNLWLGDFGLHLAIKPMGYLLRFTLIPLLAHFHIVSIAAAGILFVFIGDILRTGYTLLRAVDCLLRLQPIPWTALAISPIPTIGTLAFPCQMLQNARKGHFISQMIIYETFSAVASAFPIWGGRDNGWDYCANQLAHHIIVWTHRTAQVDSHKRFDYGFWRPHKKFSTDDAAPALEETGTSAADATIPETMVLRNRVE